MAALTKPRSTMPRTGGLSFISANPATAAFEREEKRLRQTRKDETDAAVDAATRRALAESYAPQRQQPAPAAAPAAGGQALSEGGQALSEAASSSSSAPQATATPRARASSTSGNPLAGVVASLANVPGAGSAALRLAQRGETMGAARTRAATMQDRQQAQYEQRALVALAKGDMAAAQHWAARSGFQLPPELAQNAEAAGLFARGSLLARGLYPNKPQALAFAQAYVRSGGDVQAATAAAGQPRPAERAQSAGGGGGAGGRSGSASYAPTTVIGPDGEPVRALYNRRNPDEPLRFLRMPNAPAGQAPATPQQPAGAPPLAPPDATLPAPAAPASPYARVPQRAAGQGSQPRTPDRQLRYEMAQRAGMSDEEAAAVAAGTRPSAGTVASAYGRIRAGITNSLAGMNMPPERVDAEAARQMDGLFGTGWRSMLQVGARPPGGGGGLVGVQAPPGATTSTPSATAASPARPAPTADAPLTSIPSGTASTPAPAGGAPARDPATTLAQARQAILRGANRQQVIERLRQMGIDPAGL